MALNGVGDPEAEVKAGARVRIGAAVEQEKAVVMAKAKAAATFANNERKKLF